MSGRVAVRRADGAPCEIRRYAGGATVAYYDAPVRAPRALLAAAAGLLWLLAAAELGAPPAFALLAACAFSAAAAYCAAGGP